MGLKEKVLTNMDLTTINMSLSSTGYPNGSLQSGAEYMNYTWSENADNFAYDYYNPQHRAERILTQPAKIIALLIGSLALILNAVSLLVVKRVLKKARRQAAHFGFLMSLGISDMLFSITLMLFILNKVINPLYFPGYGTDTQRLQSRCVSIIIKALNTCSLNAELLSLMGMALDHYIAITKPLHYALLLNKKCYIVIIIIIWTIAILCGFSDFLYVIHDAGDWTIYKDKFNLCEFIYYSKYQEEYTLFITAALCLIVMVFSYSRYVIAEPRDIDPYMIHKISPCLGPTYTYSLLN